ncbi:MAG: helix-turn-helix domain-containing protein [Clostridiales bacterium]|nr:helix-turn-helix domain-containing protein [Clostridiales bacterium]MCD8157373.1 helix-turn-helix domain-containing protein [Clostridiales bacterium]
MDNFGMKIKELRESKGLTLPEAAEKLGINRGSLSRYENGIVEPSLSTAAKIAKFYSVSLDYLAGLSDDFRF